MWIAVNPLDRFRLGRFAAPPIAVTDEEELFFRELAQPWQELAWFLFFVSLP